MTVTRVEISALPFITCQPVIAKRTCRSFINNGVQIMRIQNNNPSMKTYRSLKRNRSAIQKNLEKLASGYQINRAADDAAGLAVSEKMRMQITGLSAALKNCRDASSLLQTAEGGLTELHEMLNRAYTLAEQSANGTYDENTDRAQLQKELEGICAEIDRIAESTNFNDIELLQTAHAEAAAENTAAAANFSNRNIASASPAEPAMLALSDAAPVNSPARARAARFSARAADTVCVDFSVSGGTLGVDYTFAGGVLTVKDGANITIRNTTGAATENRIEVADGANASITLAGVNIDLSGTGDSSNATPGAAAFQISEGSTGNVTVTLRGDNSLKSGIGCAGLQKNGGADNIGKLTIAGDGKLTVSGGLSAAGIGGANGKEGSNILIAGGEVHAEGGDNLWLPSSWDAVPGGAGIGGGAQASGGRIEISGGTVDAQGGDSAAGIGGGGDRSGSEITISGGNVTAKSRNGAGIGSGSSGADGSGGSGRNITISGGTVNASSTHGGAGIGGGTDGACDGVTISAGSVTATGGEEGSGIGSSCWDSAKNITISGGTVTATGGGGAAGIGNGKDSPNGPTENTVISGGVVIATGGGTAGIQGCDALTSASGKAVVVGRDGDYYSIAQIVVNKWHLQLSQE